MLFVLIIISTCQRDKNIYHLQQRLTNRYQTELQLNLVKATIMFSTLELALAAGQVMTRLIKTDLYLHTGLPLLYSDRYIYSLKSMIGKIVFSRWSY